MNPPKGKGKATQSKEARKAGMSQKKYESTKLNQAFFKSKSGAERQSQSQRQSNPKAIAANRQQLMTKTTKVK